MPTAGGRYCCLSSLRNPTHRYGVERGSIALQIRTGARRVDTPTFTGGATNALAHRGSVCLHAMLMVISTDVHAQGNKPGGRSRWLRSRPPETARLPSRTILRNMITPLSVEDKRSRAPAEEHHGVPSDTMYVAANQDAKAPARREEMT